MGSFEKGIAIFEPAGSEASIVTSNCNARTKLQERPCGCWGLSLRENTVPDDQNSLELAGFCDTLESIRNFNTYNREPGDLHVNRAHVGLTLT